MIVGVSCSGGGGVYTLSTGTGNLNKLDGHIEINATDYISHVEVKCEAGPEVTYLYSFSSTGNFINNYAPPVSTLVTPDPLINRICLTLSMVNRCGEL